MKSPMLILLWLMIHSCLTILPPRFQWKTIEFAWEAGAQQAAITSGAYIPKNNIPSGIARWKNKLFITIPRWKKGVPASLNYIYTDGNQSQPLNPYPSWNEAFVSSKACCISSNATVVSTFKIHVDKCDRLWVVDNGVTNMLEDIKQITPAAVVVFNLNSNKLLHRYELDDEVLRESSVLNSIVVDIAGKECNKPYAYISDMGSNAIIIYSLQSNEAWRIENNFFHFDPLCGVYNVGGVEFYWSDGVSSIVILPSKKHGNYDLYFHPTSSTRQFRMSTKLLRNKNATMENIFAGVEVIGDRGPKSQATAADYDPVHNVMFYTQLSKNGVSCWNLNYRLNEENAPLLISDCTVLEFPNDIQVDQEGNLWILSNKHSRYLSGSLDLNQINFRVLTAPTGSLIQGSQCEKTSTMSKAFSFVKRSKSSLA